MYGDPFHVYEADKHLHTPAAVISVYEQAYDLYVLFVRVAASCIVMQICIFSICFTYPLSPHADHNSVGTVTSSERVSRWPGR